MRVSQNYLYNTSLSNMLNASSDLVEVNEKMASEKKINKPSDDPLGMTRVLGYQDSIAALQQYQDNIDTAKGWLNLADETLMQVNVVVTRIKELAEQAATGTLDANNREEISYEVNQLFDQLVSLANTEYEGNSIFAGHKLEDNAYKRSLALTSNDENVPEAEITGNVYDNFLVQFENSGTVGIDTLNYRFSSDGGSSWETATLNAGDTDIALGGTTLSFSQNFEVNASEDYGDTEGTWLYVRPTAEYLGDDEGFTAWDSNGNIVGTVQGTVDPDLNVVINAAGDQYSINGGAMQAISAGPPYNLEIPGGTLTMASIAGGEDISFSQNNAALNVEISQQQTVQVNNIGMDIFGGIQKIPGSDIHYTPNSGSDNLFETVGQLVSYLQNNNQEGVSEMLGQIEDVQLRVTNRLATVGARENRLDVAETVMSGLELNEETRKSRIEDVDVAEVMTDLSRQQFVYEAVLKTSSIMMKLNLMDYI